MLEEKESFWKKKGFYLSTCAAILCVLAIGTLYYKINYQNNDGKIFLQILRQQHQVVLQAILQMVLQAMWLAVLLLKKLKMIHQVKIL